MVLKGAHLVYVISSEGVCLLFLSTQLNLHKIDSEDVLYSVLFAPETEAQSICI